MAKLLLYPALIMSFGFGIAFGYTSRPTVESGVQTYQMVKATVFR